MTINQNKRFTDKVAFITGAAGGIGKATALAFAREGANIILVDLDEIRLEETVNLIEKIGQHALAITADVRNSQQIKNTVDRAVATFGHIDLAFNNAGVEQPVGPIGEVTEDDWYHYININLNDVFLYMKYLIPVILRNVVDQSLILLPVQALLVLKGKLLMPRLNLVLSVLPNVPHLIMQNQTFGSMPFVLVLLTRQ